MFQIHKPERIPVDITTTEYDLVELIKKVIADEDPSIDVTEVRLVGLEAIEIDAFVGEPKPKRKRRAQKAKDSEPAPEPEKAEVTPEVLDEVVAAKEEAEKADLPFDIDDVADPEAESNSLTFADQEMSLIDEVLAEEANDVSINELTFETDEPKKGGSTVADIFGG